MDVWRSFLRAHARIVRALESELLADQQLSLASYDVLVQLAEAPQRRLRMTELADAVLLSRSGVTRLVDRLEKAGFVTRARVDSDGRGVEAVLTDAGLDRLRSASGTHLSGVVEHFADVLEPDELAAFGQTCERLGGATESTGDALGEPVESGMDGEGDGRPDEWGLTD
ncbi:MAG TPA: MarR family transcriptional regulator [Pseudonocardiaceae bacterium]|nr:MarR family transcriptional regulator [Pseudonocardiaceae bacterium]